MKCHSLFSGEKKKELEALRAKNCSHGSRILDNFSNFLSTSHHGTSYQVSSQLAFWLRCSNQNFKVVSMAAILDSALERFSYLQVALIFPTKF